MRRSQPANPRLLGELLLKRVDELQAVGPFDDELPLILDEPFEGLAPALARRLGEVLANLKSEGVSVLISESNEMHVADLLARAYRIERGAVTKV